jgi:Retroviral aspartyl protease
MCLLQGFVLIRSHQIPARILLDSGSDRQYVSQRFVDHAALQVTDLEHGHDWVQVANGAYSRIPGKTSFTLLIGRYRSRIEARILDLPDFDIILGYDWLRTINPIIDWRQLQIQVRDDQGILHDLIPMDTNRYISPPRATEVPDLISASQANRLMRAEGADTLVYAIRKVAPSTDSSSMPTHSDERIQQLLTDFRDNLRKELPNELPPTRDYEHKIDTGDSSPINLNAYPLSPVHLVE